MSAKDIDVDTAKIIELVAESAIAEYEKLKMFDLAEIGLKTNDNSACVREQAMQKLITHFQAGGASLSKDALKESSESMEGALISMLRSPSSLQEGKLCCKRPLESKLSSSL